MIKESVYECIGNTPLVELQHLPNATNSTKIYGKIEYINPGLSIKDRAALRLIEDAEKRQLIIKGDTIVESTSGNMGHSLAMICAAKGYKLICIVDPKTPKINIEIYRAYGASILLITEMDEYGGYQKNRILTAKKIGEKINHFNLDQYSNPSCKSGNYNTGYEIFSDLNGKIDVLIASVSTGGHLSGVSKYLKQHCIKKPIIVGVEPLGSIIFGGCQMPYKQNGTGLSFVPDNYTPSLVDIKLKCNDNDAFSMCRYIAKNEGILLGGSSGSVLWAASKLLKSGDIKQDSNIVCILPDGGIKYIDSIYKEVKS
ncbi:cysteine synthase family protein [bacterium endosymbiont of Bathymodiolus sp. 5 South]|jgi:cysteine synthase|uniref:cysteine synthase family protein n=1 Tax=bacterium endosymbiont of Bathymodiolus sp. 5 South TaxID=1181670 RepID=UPI0010B4B817|nr:cysteine synthase family protein [bacterium endosymbiont of Bathymodiolus sp. 5 South]CAC9657499.1 Cysteine synthase (EC 2.5.1.47) [uncultured Gammaproteobacteria bacterium]SHN93458.1 Cysteine synthase [bacterium endosymbiont of Bathymodiolus sp. 5 South]SSC09067.1 Cysteine synthase [bacterium endosymbiont of Bathymodiolus sp. 5 South]VVH55095.1 Cysteine synthase (EC [uncultured Gammaproteobacteria bacterium]VVH61348.1 Cysteine synthase (EC [uncultured Gammaproteobacteria bacterium]